jgi:hypothetical protein
MHCDGPRGLLASRQEPLQDRLRRVAAIKVVHIVMVDTAGHKALLVVVLLVQPNDRCDTLCFEVRDDVIDSRGVVALSSSSTSVVGASEGEETAVGKPVHVAVLYPLIMLILFDVKIIPVKAEKPALSSLVNAS